MAMAGTPVDHSNIANLRDIMSTYNKMTHACFKFCISNMNYPKVTTEEETCINRCSGKYINGNNKVMQTFMEIQTRKQKAMIEEAEQKERDRLAGVDTTPNLPGPANAANILFNAPQAADASSSTSQPAPPTSGS